MHRRLAPCSLIVRSALPIASQTTRVRGELCPNWASRRHVRILLYGHYRIAYLIKADGNIDILGVFHGSLDISKYQL